MAESARKEKYLEVERPSSHVFVEIAEVWIVVDTFEERRPSEVVAKKSCKRTFTGSDITGNRDVLGIWLQN